MAKLLIKSNVKPYQSLIIIAAAINAANAMNLRGDVVVTSANDSKHMNNSLHYKDKAVDFRTKHLTPLEKREWIRNIQVRLGVGYQTILESENEPNEHLHVEFDYVNTSPITG